jgi:ribonucleoside-diphosphate reductase beta chain
MSTVVPHHLLRSHDSAGVPQLPGIETGRNILDPGFSLTLRPMRYPAFYDMYRDAIANTWTVEEVDFSTDLIDLRGKLTREQHHLVKRLVAFFATGDSIVGNNLVLHLYRHINSPEARMYLGRQLYEEMLHVQFYLTLLDNYVPDPRERQASFAAVENIPSIKRKADFCFRWMGSMDEVPQLRTIQDRRRFLLHLICFAACVEGLFFFAAFSYVYFLRDKGLLKGLADGTNWVFRDESMHMDFGFEVVRTVRREEPELWTDELQSAVRSMLVEAIDCELQFARDMLGTGIPGLSIADIGRYLEYVADQRLTMLGIPKHFGTKNPFSFMELQDVQGLSNFFERGVASYQIGVTGTVDLAAAF